MVGKEIPERVWNDERVSSDWLVRKNGLEFDITIEILSG